MNEVYRMLLQRKLANESFSDTLRRVLSEKRNIMEFAGAWKDMGAKEADELKRNITNIRKGMGNSFNKRVKENDLSG